MPGIFGRDRHRLAVLLVFFGTLGVLLLAGIAAFALVLFVGQRHVLFENYVYGDIGNPKQIGFSAMQVVHTRNYRRSDPVGLVQARLSELPDDDLFSRQ